MTVARYNVDGSLDTSFGTNGIASVDFAGESQNPLTLISTKAMAIQPDNKIVIAGQGVDAYNPRSYALLARLDVNGALDPTFSDNGKVVLDPYTDDTHGLQNDVNDVKIQGDGKIVVARHLHSRSEQRLVRGRRTAEHRWPTRHQLRRRWRSRDRRRQCGQRPGASRFSIGSDGKITLAGTTFTIAAGGVVTSKVMVARCSPMRRRTAASTGTGSSRPSSPRSMRPTWVTT